MARLKFNFDEVVGYGDGLSGVIVHVRHDEARPYLVVQTDGQGRKPRGAAHWKKASDLKPTGKIVHRPGVTYRHNVRLAADFDGHRGCDCGCCPHISEGMFTHAVETDYPPIPTKTV